jgi:hypothetical protein
VDIRSNPVIFDLTLKRLGHFEFGSQVEWTGKVLFLRVSSVAHDLNIL